MRNHKVRVVSALLLTFVLQTFALLSFCFFARALGMDGPLSQFFIYIAFGLLIAAIPISPPQAIGVLEVAFIQFFAQDGLNSASQAVALALGKRLIELFWSLPGILVPLLGAHLPSATDLEQLGIEASGEPASPGGLRTSVALQPASTPQ